MTRFTTTKSLLLSAALFAGGATFASADTQLRAQVADQLSTYSMNVDVDSLTDEQVAELHLITSSTMVESEKPEKIENVLNEWNVEAEASEDYAIGVEVPRNSMVRALDQFRVELGLPDVRFSTLTDDQVGALYLIATGGETDTMKKTKAEAVIN